jgi:hypothetical protein
MVITGDVKPMYFAEINVAEPLEKLLGDWDLLDERVIKKISTFKEFGDNVVGIRRRVMQNGQIHDPVKGVLPQSVEITNKGLVQMEHDVLTVRITVAGTPHRVPHNFGFWHINDADELYVTLPPPAPGEPSYFLVVMGNPSPSSNEGESWAQYCQICLTMLHEHYYKTSELGMDGHWRANLAAIREYNSDVKFRSCPECGHVNPLGYVWNTVKDTPEEAAARKQW